MLSRVAQIQNAITIAAQSLRAHIGRTILTVLGVMIGIATIVIILSSGEGLKNIILSQLGSFGSDTVFVEIKIPESSQFSSGTNLVYGVSIDTLKVDEMRHVRDSGEFPDVQHVYGVQVSQAFAVHENIEMSTGVMAVSTDYIDIDSADVAQGRFFTEEEDRSLARVVILGSETAERLFVDEDPIGQYVKFNQINWRVIGVLEEKSASFALNFNKQAYVPLETYRKLVTGRDYLQYFVVQVTDVARLPSVKDQLTEYLMRAHDIEEIEKIDFNVTTMDEALDMVNTILGGIRLLLGAIAAISLLVGGIGIMNIMLVSVTERTKEIGLRKSVGARQRDILTQFLWEAVMVTGLGAVVGIIVGILVTLAMVYGAQYAGLAWEFTLSIPSIVAGLLMAGVTGLGFGMYPAWKASQLDPIVALRKA